jgi:YidC/Oxa1 family membrane protein insertase
MEKRVLLAIVLSIAVMYGYSMLVPQSQRQSPAVPAASTPAAPVVTPSAGTQASTGALATPAATPGGAVVQDVVVETDLYRAVFSTLGGALKHLELKEYKDVAGPNGKPEVLFNADQPASYTLSQSFPGLPVDGAALFTPSATQLQIGRGDHGSLEFTAVTSQGIVLKKRYTFSGASYAIGLAEQLSNTGSQRLEGSVQLLLKNRVPTAQGKDSRFEAVGPVTLANNEVVFDKLANLAKEERPYNKGVQWSGFGDKYFLNAVMAKDNSIQAVNLKEVGGYLESRFTSNRFVLNPNETVTVPFQLYFGPKALDQLKAQGNRLEAVIDLGWFSAIAKPLLYTLKFFYGYLHNYGLAIIVITVILKVLFFPLTHKSYKSMKEMQKLQPKMQALKEKFKDDRDAMNRAVMELYKEHKVNPLGGCLPMVIQIPVFFALYKALMFSIELRHAPFYFWIHDLAGKDPYYVTPIIMGATMFIQQKMTPSNMDPVQAKMMLALPVVFTFMFLNFPSGLVLYWLVNNILTIAQQAYINKSLKEA